MGRREAVCWNVRDGARERDWVRAHTALTRLARERAAADAEEARWLLLAWRSGAHVHLGYGSFSEYIERLFGYSPRATRDKLRVAEALDVLPLSARALERGELSWCAARELTRVATADTEASWLDAARSKTTRELERLVAGKHAGDWPPQPGDPEGPRRQVLRFDVAPETFATFREALHSLRRAAGGTLEDDALLLQMARRVLGAPRDDGRSSHRLSYEICPACGQGAQLAAGERVAVSAEVLAMAACDGERHGVHAVNPANENGAAETSHSSLLPSNETHTIDATGTIDPTGTVGATHVGRALPVEPLRARARQGVPPALRRAVLARDRHRCQVPGCTNTHFVDVHHIVPRSEGGRDLRQNLITLCTAHHRAAHRGELIIESSGAGPEIVLTFRHADGAPYGQRVAAAPIDAYAKVFAALRHLGFREREAQAVLAELRADASLHDAPVETLLREALRRIGPHG